MKSNKPSVQLSNVNKEWEKIFLGEISEIKTGPFGSALHAKDYVVSGTPIITTEHFKTGELPLYKAELPQVSNEDYKRLKSYRLKHGDLVFSRVGSVDINALVTEAQSGWLFSGRVLRVRPIKNVDGSYLHYLLDTTLVKNDILSRAVGQTMPSINTEILKNTLIHSSTDVREQKKIGLFFKNLDDTISLHQQELDALKQAKQGFLQKMFPSKGQSVPEIRFKEFKDMWSYCKLNEISEKVKEKNVDNAYSETLTNSAEFGIINQRDFFDKDISNKLNLYTYYVVQPDDFVYNPRISKLAPVGPIKRNKLGRAGVMSPLYYVFRIRNLDLTYLEYYFSTEKWHMFMKLNGDSGARSDRISIKDSIFSEMPIPLPSIEEQFKIGEFFKRLDEMIDLKEQELEALKQTKKGFLQKMFV